MGIQMRIKRATKTLKGAPAGERGFLVFWFYIMQISYGATVSLTQYLYICLSILLATRCGIA